MSPDCASFMGTPPLPEMTPGNKLESIFLHSKSQATSSYGEKSPNYTSSLGNIPHHQETSCPANKLLSTLVNAKSQNMSSAQRSPNWNHFLSYQQPLSDNGSIDLTLKDNSSQPVVVENLDLSAKKSQPDNSDANTEKCKSDTDIEEFVFDSSGARVTFRYQKMKKILCLSLHLYGKMLH